MNARSLHVPYLFNPHVFYAVVLNISFRLATRGGWVAKLHIGILQSKTLISVGTHITTEVAAYNSQRQTNLSGVRLIISEFATS